MKDNLIRPSEGLQSMFKNVYPVTILGQFLMFFPDNGKTRHDKAQMTLNTNSTQKFGPNTPDLRGKCCQSIPSRPCFGNGVSSINYTLRQARYMQLQCARLNFPHRRLTFVIGFVGPGPACEASHILEKALELMVKRRSSNLTYEAL